MTWASELLAARTAGNGLVIESGINLPYHDAVFSNATESLLLARMIQTATARWWASGLPAQTGAVLAVTRSGGVRGSGVTINLEPYADLLAARLGKESDVSVLAALKDLVAMHQWEPVSSAASLELRLWAARMATVSAGESVHP